MKLSKFSLDLPKELIAQEPTKTRDDSKLMVLDRKTQTITHHVFRDILNILDEGDLILLNNTKVFPAKMYGNKEKTGAQIEVFLLRELNEQYKLWDVLVDPARKIRVGNKLYFGDDDLVAEVVDNTTSRGRTIRFLFDGNKEDFNNVVKKIGETPLPKYIERPATEDDFLRYQTIFATEDGAVAPPTAGLHFTKELLMRMDIKGVNIANITLHQGLGTFRTVEVEDLSKHKMDSENYTITEEAANLVNQTKNNGKRVVAVGSGVMRAIESSVSSIGHLNPSSGWTDKFIAPPYDFSIANSFLTNFHAPESTLMILASSFGGYEFVYEAYKKAIENKYRFMCYGDAMLIL